MNVNSEFTNAADVLRICSSRTSWIVIFLSISIASLSFDFVELFDRVFISDPDGDDIIFSFAIIVAVRADIDIDELSYTCCC